jgi:hypothetical protein
MKEKSRDLSHVGDAVSSKKFGPRFIGQKRDGRRGDVFSVRLTDEERGRLEARQDLTGGPRALGPWLKWFALTATPPPKPSLPLFPDDLVPVGMGVVMRFGDLRDWSFPVGATPPAQLPLVTGSTKRRRKA